MRTKIKIENEKQKKEEEEREEMLLKQRIFIKYETEQVRKRQRIYRFIRDNIPTHFNTVDLRKLTVKIMKVMGEKK